MADVIAIVAARIATCTWADVIAPCITRGKPIVTANDNYVADGITTCVTGRCCCHGGR